MERMTSRDEDCVLANGQITLLHGDCLELLKGIKDGSVDMVLSDLPYGVTDNEWDNRIDANALFREYRRVCKQNANVLLFAQIAFAKYLMECAHESEFSHCLIWAKNNVTRSKSAAKLPLSSYEMICVFRVNKYGNKGKHKDLRDYFVKELSRCGKTVEQIECEIPNYSAHHWFRYSSDYRIPTESNYKRLQEVTGCFQRPYDDVKSEFTSEKNNLCTYNRVITRDIVQSPLTETRVHPTQKPVNLLEQLIETYSNEGDAILDNTMGSGSTGVACINTGRKFIGMEINPGYFEVAKRRVEEALQAMRDMEELDACEICKYGQTDKCTAPKELKLGGSCFCWRGKEDG